MNPVVVKNLNALFSREVLIYSFYDVKLKKPARLVTIGYFIALALITTVPVLILTGFESPKLVIVTLALSIGGAMLMSKPIWGGRSFFKYMKIQIKYIMSPRFYADNKPAKDNVSLHINSTIQVSRHDDYNKLYQITKEELDDKLK